jgi:hypothetical protein
MMTGIDMCLFIGYTLNYIMYIYIFFYSILNLGKHPFLNKNGMVNHKKQGNGEYEKVMEVRYSPALVNLMEKMMHVV